MDTVQLGEKEYTLEELQGLVADGEQKREYETKYNTPFDKAWSAYGKTQNENRELQERLRQLEEQTKVAPVAQPTNATEPAVPFDPETLKDRFVAKDEVETFIDQRLAEKEKVTAIVSQFKKLESEIDGNDGRPPFKTDEVFAFMQENSIVDPDKAYKLMHLDDLSAWKAEQISKKPNFAQTNQGQTAVDKSPKPVSFNRDNIDQGLREALTESSGKF